MIGWIGGIWFLHERGQEMRISEYMKQEEGEVKSNGVHKPYRCPKGALTIGYGHNLEANGISDGIADLLLEQDLETARNAARRLVANFDQLNDVRQCVIVSMVFQLGVDGFADFRKTRAHIERGSWRLAAMEMSDSDWYRDLKKFADDGWTRADRECEMMRTGEWIAR